MALSLGQKAGWGLADMGIVVFVIVKQLLVLAFLTNYLGVPIQTAGLLTTLVLIFDIISVKLQHSSISKIRADREGLIEKPYP